MKYSDVFTWSNQNQGKTLSLVRTSDASTNEEQTKHKRGVAECMMYEDFRVHSTARQVRVFAGKARTRSL